MSNLSYFNMRFFFKAFRDISQNGLKILFYNNKMQTSAELMEILKENEIRRYSHYTKSKLIDLLIKKGLISNKYGTNKREKAKKDIDSVFEIHHKWIPIHSLHLYFQLLYLPSVYPIFL